MANSMIDNAVKRFTAPEPGRELGSREGGQPFPLSRDDDQTLRRSLKRQEKARRLISRGGPSIVPYVMQGYRSSGQIVFAAGSAYLFGAAGTDATSGVQPGSFLKVTGVFQSALAAGVQATGIMSGINVWVNGVPVEGAQTIMAETLFPGTYSVGYIFNTGGASIRVQAVGNQPSGETGYAWAELFPSLSDYFMKKAACQGNMMEIEVALDALISTEEG